MVSSMMANVSLPLTPTKNLERSVHVIKCLKVADVILGMTFLCHENATINCAEKQVVFPDNDFVQCNDKERRAKFLVLSPTKFAKLLRLSDNELTGYHRQRKRNWYVNAKSIFQ